MEFNNIPINGSIEKFANELIKSGYTKPQLIKENQIKLNGLFLNKNCDIYVYGTRKNKTAYKVRVDFPVGVHDSLEYNFDKMQKLYSSKFGIGTNKYQQFQNSARFLFNEPKRIRQIMIGDITIYTTDSGNITLEVREGYISITYLDILNNKIRNRELNEETNKDVKMDIN